MCIIVYKPIGQLLDKKILEECYNSNAHGSGYMYVRNGKIIIDKGMDSFKKIYKRYKTAIIDQKLEKEIVVVWHFRIKTHGKVDRENCHPFYVNNGDNYAFCHNGTIRNLDIPTGSDISDTVIFRDKILNHLRNNWFDNPAIQILMSHFIQKSSKLLFMDRNENVKIMNMDLGEWDEGIWYSNLSYRRSTYKWTKNKDGHYVSSNEGIGGSSNFPDDDIILPYNIEGVAVDRFGEDKGRLWDYEKTGYVVPWEHSDPEVRAAALSDKKIMACFPDYKQASDNKAIIGKRNSDMIICGGLTLNQLVELEGRNDKLRASEPESFCYDCGMPLYTKAEDKHKSCAYCVAIGYTVGRHYEEEITGSVKERGRTNLH